MEFRRSPKKRRHANMSFGSAFGSSALGSVFGNIASLNRSTHRSGWGYAIDPLGGLMGKAFLDDDAYQDERSLAMASALTAMQYDYAIRGLKESPSAAKEGLLSAGYNPMLAIGGAMSPASVSFGNQSPKESAKGSPIDIAASHAAFSNAKSLAKKSNAEVDLINTNINSTLANTAADVNLKNAQAEKLRKEAEGIDPVARKFFESHPGATTKEFYSWVQTLDDIESMFKGNGKGSSAKEVKSVEERSREIERKFRENSKPHQRGVHKAFRDSKRDFDWSIFRTTYGY